MMFGDDEFENAFPGCDFVHVLRIVTTIDVAAARAVLDAVENSGASLISLAIVTRCDRLEHSLHLKGVRASEVRRLAASWLQQHRFLSVDVEHKILSREAAA